MPVGNSHLGIVIVLAAQPYWPTAPEGGRRQQKEEARETHLRYV